ncbi:hypothetical protein AB1L88_25770 [Tautonia sp. JC769]|uniref:hypothetical protein n=1 Tax=Tautonia sp. JC769 TaxID=3232135 RepID=UPI003459CEB5
MQNAKISLHALLASFIILQFPITSHAQAIQSDFGCFEISYPSPGSQFLQLTQFRVEVDWNIFNDHGNPMEPGDKVYVQIRRKSDNVLSGESADIPLTFDSDGFPEQSVIFMTAPPVSSAPGETNEFYVEVMYLPYSFGNSPADWALVEFIKSIE